MTESNDVIELTETGLDIVSGGSPLNQVVQLWNNVTAQVPYSSSPDTRHMNEIH